MTSVYTELTKEAAKRGGPDGLRAFYRMQGVVLGLLVGGSMQFYCKVRDRGSANTSAPATEPDREVGTGAPAPGK
ncbi:hypothetical protein [Streptomyces sp. NPDC051554]|uniref:hypothetical protein n=1 Tax=Streptomyces sp. NPDC051554 TaxID=3365656 RepID=UPI0037ADF102